MLARVRLRLVRCAVAGVALAAVTAAWAFDWQARRIEGRDYVDLEKIAVFYGLPQGVAAENSSRFLARGGRSLRAVRDSREMEINGVKHLLSFPVIERDGAWWVSRMDLGKTLEPALRPELVPDLKPFSTVILDPGHGGHDKGAIGPYEVEKNFALDVARRVRNELQKAGVRVILTRNNDAFLELHERAALANARQQAIFVSLHFNAAPNAEAEGLEIFCVTPRGSPSTEYDELLVRDMVAEYGNDFELQSFSLANAIYHALHGRLTMVDRGVKRARFAVLRLTRMPSVLVEGGFLSNPADARRIAATDWRNTYAQAVATGILEYRRLAETRTPPRKVADYRTPAARGQAVASAGPSPTPRQPSLTLRDLPDQPAN
jgi:N-acetylmuramoyl-L-alanine amidase